MANPAAERAVPTLAERQKALTDPAAAEEARQRTEDQLNEIFSRAMRKYLARLEKALNTRVRAGGTVLVAAGEPEDPITLGQASRWWAETVDDEVMAEILAAWQQAYGSIVVTSAVRQAVNDYLPRVKDRLVRGEVWIGGQRAPTIAEDSFDKARVLLARSAAEGWSRPQTAERIATAFGWETDGAALRFQLDDVNAQIDAILDPLGHPGSPTREYARLHDPHIAEMQADRAELVKQLDAEKSHWQNRAELIARTESTSLHGWSANTALAAEGFTHKKWLATGDKRTRDSHREADGQIVPVDGEFIVGGFTMQFPGDPAAPVGEIANCVVGSTEVVWPGQDAQAVTRREFVGEFIHLVTAAGYELTCTPNHPILTPFGYLPAEMLREGEDVISTSDTPLPEVDDRPARIDQLYMTAAKSRVPQRIHGTAMDFHGDGAESEVEIVWAYGDLRDHRNAAFSRPGKEFPLVGLLHAEALLSRPGRGSGRPLTINGLLREVHWPAAGLVRPSHQGPPILLIESGHAETIGLRGGPGWQAEFLQPANDGGTAASEVLRHLENATALGMKPDKLIKVERYTGRHVVYNLSTSDEWYIGNGIAQHNCRCTMIGADTSGEESIGDEPTPPTQAGDAGGGSPETPIRGIGEPPDENNKDAWDRYWKERQDALEGRGFTSNGEILGAHEVQFVERFIAAGQHADWIPRDLKTFRSTNDFWWFEQAVEIELKATGPDYRTIHGRIVDAASRAWRNHQVIKDNFIIDIGDEELTDQLKGDLAGFNVGRRKYRLARLWVMSGGRVIEIGLEQ